MTNQIIRSKHYDRLSCLPVNLCICILCTVPCLLSYLIVFPLVVISDSSPDYRWWYHYHMYFLQVILNWTYSLLKVFCGLYEIMLFFLSITSRQQILYQIKVLFRYSKVRKLQSYASKKASHNYIFKANFK